MNEPLKGLTLYIHRYMPHGDTSHGGISSRADRVTLVGIVDKRDPNDYDKPTVLPRSSRVFEPSADAPPVVLVYRRRGEQTICHVQPYDEWQRHWMMGGTYVTGDSRFSDLIGFYGAVAFHDRHEG